MQFKLFEKHTSTKKFQNCEQGKSYDYPWIISEAYNSDNIHEKIYVINIFILFPCFYIMFPHFCTVFTEIYIAISQSDSRNVFHVFYHYQNNSGTVLRDYTGMSYDYCTSVFVQAEKITSRHFSLLVLSIFRKNSRNSLQQVSSG